MDEEEELKEAVEELKRRAEELEKAELGE